MNLNRRIINRWDHLKRIVRPPYFSTVRVRLTLYFVTISLTCIAVIGVFSFRESSQNIQRDVIAASQQTVDLVNNLIETHVDQYDRISLRLALSDAAQRWYLLGKNELNSLSSLEAEYAIKTNHLFTLFWDKYDLEQVTLISYEGNVLKQELLNASQDDPRSYPWMSDIPDNGKLFISPVYKFKDNRGINVITLIRRVGYPSPLRKGYIFLDMRLDQLRQITSSVQFGKHGYLMILHQNGTYIWHPDESRLGEPVDLPYKEKINSTDSGYFFAGDGASREMVFYQTSSLTGWKLIAVIPYHEVAASVYKIRDFTSVIAIVSTGLAIVMGALLAQKVTRPLARLKVGMVQVKNGRLDVTLPVNGKDEISSLSVSFNYMVQRLHELMESNYNYRSRETRILLKQREASLYALQAQMNPHFLYNSLETINSLAVVADQPQISKVAVWLADILRYSADFQTQQVPLQLELDYVNTFLQILKIRYEERLNTYIDIPEELLDATCLKLSIQPLVENSCKFGLDVRKVPLTIRIHALATDSQIILSVEDDGPGMESNALSALQHKLTLNEEQKDTGGLGLLNVNSRLVLAFGDEYRLVIRNRIEGGLKVVMRLPRVT